MPEYPSYTIRTIEDFAQVPEERMGDCLHDFALSVYVFRRTKAAVLGMAEEAGRTVPSDVVQFPEFVWVDDGERHVQVTYTNKP